MKKQKRGRCVIISNQVFYGPLKRDRQGVSRCILPARQGTAKDVLNLTHLFEQFHFDVAEHTEKKAQVRRGLHRPWKVMENDLGPGKLLEF